MPRAEITKELSETIKNFRIKNNIASKDLAAHIKKSPAYITKIEKCEINSIDINELSVILRFITNEKNDTKSAEQIYSSLKLNYTPEEIDSQLWFRNFDTIKRKVPIPKQLLEFINLEIETNSISRAYLNRRINSNEALMPHEINDASRPCNIWYTVHNNDTYKSNIKISVTMEEMDEILNGTSTSTSYMFIFCIVFYIFKIERFGETVNLTDTDYTNLYNKTTQTLNYYKFYSIAERNSLYGQEVRKVNKELEDMLSSFSQENSEYIAKILKHFMLASDYDMTFTNKKLHDFEANLNWDLGFMLSLISLNYLDLKDLSIKNRKAILNDIKKLLKQYKEMPTEQNLIEDY